MKTTKTGLLAIILLCSMLINAQELIKGSATCYETLKLSFETKINWVQNHPEEHALAQTEGWYETMNSNIQELVHYKTLAEASPDGIYLANNGYRSLNSDTAGTICSEALRLCLDSTNTYPCGTDAGDAEIGPNYGCLGSEPNPAWYYLQIGVSGDLVMSLSSPNDIDFIIWGPFTDITCDYNDLSEANIVDCSYSSTNQETPEIGPGSSQGPTTATSGEYYMLLVTNFSNNADNFTLEKTAGDATTQCYASICELDTSHIDIEFGDCYPLQQDSSTINSMYDFQGLLTFNNNQVIDSVVILFDGETLYTEYSPSTDSIVFEKDFIVANNNIRLIEALFYSSGEYICYQYYSFLHNPNCNYCFAYAGEDIYGCNDLLTNASIDTSFYGGFWSSLSNDIIFENLTDTNTTVNCTALLSDTTSYQLIWTVTNNQGLNCLDTINATFFPNANLENINSSNETICQYNEITLTTDYDSSFTYQWILPMGWTGSDSTHTITTTNNGQSGTVQAIASNACGWGDTLSLYIEVINSVAEQPSLIDGPTTVCKNSEVSYSVENRPGVTHYWSWPIGWTGQSQADNVTAYTNNDGGTITVVPFNDCGMGVARTLSIDAIDGLIPNVIYQQNGSVIEFINLTEGIETAYWEFDDGNISYEISPTHDYIYDGYYSTIMIATNQCDTAYLYFDIEITGVGIKETETQPVKIFPNPAKEQIQITGFDQKTAQIQIVDMAGKMIKIIEKLREKQSINISDLPPGLYQIKIISEKQTSYHKLTIE